MRRTKTLSWAGVCIFSVLLVAVAAHNLLVFLLRLLFGAQLIVTLKTWDLDGRCLCVKEALCSKHFPACFFICFCWFGLLKAHLWSPLLFPHFLERFLIVLSIGFPWLMRLLPASLSLVLCLTLGLSPLSALGKILCTKLYFSTLIV